VLWLAHGLMNGPAEHLRSAVPLDRPSGKETAGPLVMLMPKRVPSDRIARVPLPRAASVECRSDTVARDCVCGSTAVFDGIPVPAGRQGSTRRNRRSDRALAGEIINYYQ
jgi:hypothetical protein